MRISLSEVGLATVLSRGTRVKKVSTFERGEQLRRQLLIVLAKHGHVRPVDVAAALWPHARFAEQLAGRQLKRLELTGLLIARSNAVGATSYVLTRRGAALAEAFGARARHGLDLTSVAGATFIHRAIGTRFGIEMEKQGCSFFGEHAILTGQAPYTAEQLISAFGKLPDFLLRPRGADGYWFGEVEVAAKAVAELERCVRVAITHPVAKANALPMLGVLFLCDDRLNHEKKIRNVASRLILEGGARVKTLLASRVRVALVTQGPRAKWIGMTSPTSLEI